LDHAEELAVPTTENVLICSCCGQPVRNSIALFDDNTHVITTTYGSQRFSRRQYRVAKALTDAYPNTATKEHLYDRVFMDATGDGPDIKIVDVVVCHIRPPLADLGLIIGTVWGVGYKMTLTDPAMLEQIKRSGVSIRAAGSRKLWTPDLDPKLMDLMKRKYGVSACARALGMPYMATQRAMDRLQAATLTK